MPILILFSAGTYLYIKKKPAPLFAGDLGQAHKQNSRTIATYTLEQFEIKARSKQMIEEGREKYKAEDYDSANKVLSNLLNQYPYAGYREEASCLLAQGLFHEGHWEQSEKVINNLKEHNPDSQSSWLACALLVEGQIYEKKGQVDKAIQLYRQVIISVPDNKILVQQAEDLLMQISL